MRQRDGAYSRYGLLQRKKNGLFWEKVSKGIEHIKLVFWQVSEIEI